MLIHTNNNKKAICTDGFLYLEIHFKSIIRNAMQQ